MKAGGPEAAPRAEVGDRRMRMAGLEVEAAIVGDPDPLAAVGDALRAEEFDELVVSWRLRHIQLVERVIGVRMGTGGSTGASYLKLTLDKKFFPELWEARTLLTE